MNGRAWTQHEVWLLLSAAEKSSQASLARKLGRSKYGVLSKVERSGIRWRRGHVSVLEVSKRVGCSSSTAGKAADALGFKRYGSGNGRRYLLTPEEADRLERHLRRRLETYAQQHEAGKLRQVRRTEEGS